MRRKCPPRNTKQVVAAKIIGGPLAPDIQGWVWFTPTDGGSWVNVSITGLPPYQEVGPNGQPIGPFGFHIHENGDCTVGDVENPFQAAGGHWDPDNQPHGNHAGDLPVLFSNDGIAKMRVYTNRFSPRDVLGKGIIIHMNPDDYRTQPAGNAGPRLACGVIGIHNGKL